jgi:hypothetical protein
MVTQPYHGEAGANQTEPSPWFPGQENQFGSSNQITSTFIANAQINLAHINTASIGSLSALSANIGTVTAGVVQSSDGQMVMNLSAGNLTIWGA